MEYSYRDGISQKEIKNYCVQKLGQPDFFPYRVDYTDEKTIKLSGYSRKSLKGMRFNLLMEFGTESVRVSSQLIDKKGLNLDCGKYFTKKGKLKNYKIKEEVEPKVNGIILSLMDMKIIVK
ncbi:MAG: hypothetical protein IJK87_07160 [Prevotella sp.]|nr:hypothetical protein [Prevotella sp.]